MGEPLNIPFQSEAYDRLRALQLSAEQASSAVKAYEGDAAAIEALHAKVVDLKAVREDMGLIQAQLSERLGIDAPRISQWENGKPIPVYIDLAMRCLLALEALK